MAPKLIVLMRHAEKPDSPKNRNLSKAGRKRAKALVNYVPEKFGKPDYIFSAANSRHSHRPYETVKPLAKSLDMKIDSSIADENHSILSKEIMEDSKYDGKFILICWHHGYILDLADELQADLQMSRWPADIFNELIKIKYGPSGVTAKLVLEKFAKSTR